MTWTTLDPATAVGGTLSGGNLVFTRTSGTGQLCYAANGLSSGKYYFEIAQTGAGTSYGTGGGVALSGKTAAQLTAATAGVALGGTYGNGSEALVDGATSFQAAVGESPSSGCFAVDLDNGLFWYRQSPSANWNNSSAANPSTKAGGFSLGSMVGTTVYPFVAQSNANSTVWTCNFGASAFSGSVPGNFTAGWPTSPTVNNLTVPSVDGFASAIGTHVTSAVVTLTTTQANDIIVVSVLHEYVAGLSVTGVSAAGLTFTRRSTTTGTPTGLWTETVDVWTAVASAALSAVPITVSYSASTDDTAIIACGVHGVANTASPWDTNVSLPSSSLASSGSTAPTSTYSTTGSNDLLLIANGNSIGGTPSGPAGAVAITTVTNAGGTKYAYFGLFYKNLGAPVTSGTVVSAQNGSIMTVDAFLGSTGGGGGGGGAHRRRRVQLLSG